MTDAMHWNQLAAALRELHRALMERAKLDYQRDQLVVLSPGELLRLLTTDPSFEWLRGLSELMVDIDVVRDDAQLMDELAPAVRGAVEHFITAPKTPQSAGLFAERYWPYVQDDPHVAMAHAGVKRALRALPRPEKDDAASLLHERHQLAEKAHHQRRKS